MTVVLFSINLHNTKCVQSAGILTNVCLYTYQNLIYPVINITILDI